jgi:predicted PurR-regulated permease PerM
MSASPDPGSLRTSSVLRPLRPLIITGAVIMLAAAASLAREVLMPLALAMLLAFVLSPVADALQRWRLGRVTSVLVVVVLAFSVLGGAAWGLSQQVATVGAELPRYSAAIKEKVVRWRRGGAGRVLGRVRSSVDEVVDEIQKADTPPRREKPMPVVIQGTDKSPLQTITALTAPLATAGFVGLLVIFMLLERAELRNRLIRLVGYGHLTLTTKALDEAGERISRYLFGQFTVNGGLALAFGLGLFLIGIPYAFLWGASLGVMRFIPYIGVWLGVAPPILFSLASFDGWTKPVLVAGLFLVLEVVLSGFIEPVLYSQRAGVSKVALLVAVAFWTWLWGPVGLVLATPLTVCLLVLAKYTPEMDFLAILVGDEPALKTSVTYYQRLIAEDLDEASDIVEEFVKTHPAETVYDELLVPALVCAKRDRTRGRLSEDGEAFIVRATREIVEDLGRRDRPGEPSGGADAPAGVRVLGCPARDAADEMALTMFRQLLEPGRVEMELVSTEVLSSEVVALVETARPDIICVSALPPGGLAHARYLCKRLRARYPEVKILVCRWGVPADHGENWDVLLSAGADHVSGRLLETRDHLSRIAALAPSSRAVA